MQKNRYGVWYILLNTKTGARLFVKTFVNDPEPTLSSVYPFGAGRFDKGTEVYECTAWSSTAIPT